MASTGSRDRVAWVDYSKGICIVAVVGLYTTMFVKDGGGSTGWMQYWVDFARPFRMPDFFLISGLFLSRRIAAPWREFLDKKVVHFFYFFAVWTTIYFVLSEARISHFLGEPHSRVVEYLWLYIEPFHMLWFIELLPVFFMVTRLLGNVPWYLVLPAAATLQMLDFDHGQLGRFCERYVYFYAGYAFAPLAFRFADWAGRNFRLSLGVLCGWAVVNEALVLRGVSEAPGIGLALGFAGASAVIVTGRLLSLAPGTGWLRYLGQNSIVVFLSFFVFTATALKVLDHLPVIDIGTRELLASIVGVAAPVLLSRIVRNTPARFLFVRPGYARIGAGARQPVQA